MTSLRAARVAAGFASAREAVDAFNAAGGRVSLSTWRRMESLGAGAMPLSRALGLASFFGVALSDLISGGDAVLDSRSTAVRAAAAPARALTRRKVRSASGDAPRTRKQKAPGTR